MASAAKRADAVASEIAVHTEHNTEEIKSLLRENTELTAAVKANTDLLHEISARVCGPDIELRELPRPQAE